MLPQHLIQTRRGRHDNLDKAETDRISELPDDILSLIILNFTPRDAANASVLSRKWRRLCALCTPYLDFDWYTMFRGLNNSAIWWNGQIDLCQQYKDLFVRGVNQFIQFYNGAEVLMFQVSFCLNRDSSSDIDRWVSFAASRGVKGLVLNLSCFKFILPENRNKGNELYIFHPALLSQGQVSKLNYLWLHSCILGEGLTDQFISLKVLKLVNVSLRDQVQRVLSCCSVLNSITLADCSLPVNLCIPGSLHCLNSLEITSCIGVQKIELFASSLTSFKYYGYLIEFSFSQVPNLEKVYLGAENVDEVHKIFSQIAKDLPLVKTLSFLFASASWLQGLREHITPFRKVQQLELFSPRKTNFDTQNMISILRACPLLQQFCLVIRSVEYYDQGEMLEPTECVIHEHLKKVEISGFFGTWSQIEFAIYLLKYGVALEQMVIVPRFSFSIGRNRYVSGKRMSWDEGEREMVCERLQGYPKSAVVILNN
ncbi:hypothetical protein L1049_024031 [Liquidambar formosana]|uniref:F-box domain-containing protein n=1 Tax=Liquidambar formosana TaxID=63359 RepID=A0AAP0RZR0_LIQFO